MIKIVRTNSENPDFRNLIRSLDLELWSRYETGQAVYDKYNKIENNNTVVLVYLNSEAIGCGCIKKYSENVAEIKRMYVKPTARGKGIAIMIVDELERWAKELGFTKAVLETGVKQPEAIRLYEKLGYFNTEKYGPYVEMEMSVCMSKIFS
jgi:putative acetyltransferase